MKQKNFESLGIRDRFGRALVDAGYQQPTPIQARAIPPLLDGNDLLGIAQTGTGKTAAFALPMLQRLNDECRNGPGPRALVLAPTRELASQIRDEVARFAQHTDLSHTVIFGGVGQNPQVKVMRRGVDVLVATPGRLLDLCGQGHVHLGDVSILILDEADRLLDMGFIRDVRKIVGMTPRKRQSLLFSATMPKEVTSLANEMLTKPVRVDVTPKEITLKEIDQRVAMVDNAEKVTALVDLLRDELVTRAIVFTRTKHGANKVAKKLGTHGIVAEAIHGNKSQSARQHALQNFKRGDARVLVATDIAARGIDIEAVSHVINFELPHEPESYVHRIGRTARAGARGVAWSLVDVSEVKRLKAIERLIRMPLVEGGNPQAEAASKPRRRHRRRRAA